VVTRLRLPFEQQDARLWRQVPGQRCAGDAGADDQDVGVVDQRRLQAGGGFSKVPPVAVADADAALAGFCGVETLPARATAL